MWKNTTMESSFGCSSYVESKGGKLSGKTEASSGWDAATGMTGWIGMEAMDDWLVASYICYFVKWVENHEVDEVRCMMMYEGLMEVTVKVYYVFITQFQLIRDHLVKL